MNTTLKPLAVRSEDPIDPTVRKDVLAELASIERRHDVTILFACEAGRRGWGVASGYDYDVRFVYVPRNPWSWYLRLEPQRDVIEQRIDWNLDINGWELRKALRLIHDSNPTLLEWLDSPVVYRERARWIPRLRVLAEAFFSPMRARHHFLSMARKNFRNLRYKSVCYLDYLPVLRHLLAARWIDQEQSMPPMRFADLVARTVHDPAAIDEINALLKLKITYETDHGPYRPATHALIESMLADAEIDRDYKRPWGDVAALDAFLCDVIDGMEA